MARGHTPASLAPLALPNCSPELKDLKDLVLADLDDLRPSAIEEDPNNEHQDVLRAFFSTTADRDEAKAALHASFSGCLFVQSVDVPDEDWAARSQAGLRALRVGRVTVAPPWDITLDAANVTVIIRPSMGFGTGHHASTRLSLLALQSLNLDRKLVLDLGTGSGVLAIAAVCLGAGRALGVDTDPDALASAAENVELNKVGDRVELREADVCGLYVTAPVVLANLTGALLERLADQIGRLVEPGGHLIATGFTDTETTVLPALEKRLTRVGVKSEAEWVCGIFQRKDAET
jgi:ribosomal protein L11 methyltransferase